MTVEVSIPVFGVYDLTTTLEYYEHILGFANPWKYGDPPGYAGISSGGNHLHFSLHAPDKLVQNAWHWLRVEDVRASHEFHKAKGANIVEPLADRPWGVASYTVLDPNGIHLVFAGTPEAHRTEEPPIHDLQFEIRVPTREEWIAIFDADHYQRHACTIASATTGVVGHYQNQPIATALVMLDEPGWLSVWNVEVVERLRGRRIGTQMMQFLINHLRESHPGAFVYLFTMKQGFYERLGFSASRCELLKL
jgi:GNAT superfamily N-acetyltransferase